MSGKEAGPLSEISPPACPSPLPWPERRKQPPAGLVLVLWVVPGAQETMQAVLFLIQTVHVGTCPS